MPQITIDATGPTKGSLVEGGYDFCGLSGDQYERTPEEMTKGLRFLNALMAALKTNKGIDLGFEYPRYGEGLLEEPSGIPDSAREPVCALLAQRLAPSIGAALTDDAKAILSNAYQDLLATMAPAPVARISASRMRTLAKLRRMCGCTSTTVTPTPTPVPTPTPPPVVVTPPPPPPPPPPGSILVALTLSNSTITENSAPGAVVGAILGKSAGSVLSLSDSVGSRFAIIGNNLVAGATNIDADPVTGGAPSYSPTIVETLAGDPGSPKSTTLPITVNNVLEVTLTNVSGTFTLPENAAAGAVAGALSGIFAGATISLQDNALGKVALSGNNIVRGPTALDFEGLPSFPFTIRQTHPDGINSPLDTILTFNVTNVFEQPNLNALTLSQTSFTIGVPATGSVIGKTAGSSISVLSSPASITFPTPTTFIYDGSGPASTPTITLIETLADSANSPRTSGNGVTIAAASSVSAPILTNLTSGWTAGQNPPQWQSEYGNPNPYIIWDSVALTGDKIRARWRINGGAWTQEADIPLDSDHALADDWLWPILSSNGAFTSGGFFEVQEQVGRFTLVSGVSTETGTSAWSTTWSDTLTAPPAGVQFQASAAQPARIGFTSASVNFTSQALRAGTGVMCIATDGSGSSTGIFSVALSRTDGTPGTISCTKRAGTTYTSALGGVIEIWTTNSTIVAANYDVHVTSTGAFPSGCHLMHGAMSGQSSLTPTDTCTKAFASTASPYTAADSLTIASLGAGIVYFFEWGAHTITWNSGYTQLATATDSNQRRLVLTTTTGTPAPTGSATINCGMIGVSFPG